MMWDAGQFLNRTTLQWRDPELFAQIKSSWTTRSGTASSDQAFLPKSGDITAQSLALNPNGTDFQGLRYGSRNLLRGRNYTVSGNRLTLAGPASWTPYQQWDAAFTAYTGDSIKPTSDFVKSLKNNARVTLTFHFWSGTSVIYHVTKTGNTVTGTAG